MEKAFTETENVYVVLPSPIKMSNFASDNLTVAKSECQILSQIFKELIVISQNLAIF